MVEDISGTLVQKLLHLQKAILAYGSSSYP